MSGGVGGDGHGGGDGGEGGEGGSGEGGGVVKVVVKAEGVKVVEVKMVVTRW